MSVIAEYSVPAARLVLGETFETHPSLSADFERSFAVGSDGPLLFVWLRGVPQEELAETLAADPTVAEAGVLDEVDGHRLYRLVLSAEREAPLYASWVDPTGVRLDAHATDGRWLDRVLFPDREALAEYRAMLSEQDLDFELKRVYESDDAKRSPELTDRQRETLLLAYERGFFDIPRRATTGELASKLGVSDQAVSERLRRGYSRLIESTIV